MWYAKIMPFTWTLQTRMTLPTEDWKNNHQINERELKGPPGNSEITGDRQDKIEVSGGQICARNLCGFI